MSSSRLLDAARAIGLSHDECAAVAEFEQVATAAYPAECAQLLELADEPDVAQRYRELALQAEDMLREETAWLAGLIRQALVETDGQAPWAVLYFTMAYKVVLCAKLERRRNPRATVTMPSPFVYAMQ
jgi:hypothetical protein